ncbi:hypothetical protein D1872_354490 [compost metagenome]
MTTPLITTPLLPSTVTTMPSLSVLVAFPVPTTAGIPSSLATIAAWAVRPPSSVTMALASFM